MKSWEQRLTTESKVMQYLTGTDRSQKQRGLSPEVLAKYRVGVTEWRFPVPLSSAAASPTPAAATASAVGQSQVHLCVTFPWVRRSVAPNQTVVETVERLKIRSINVPIPACSPPSSSLFCPFD